MNAPSARALAGSGAASAARVDDLVQVDAWLRRGCAGPGSRWRGAIEAVRHRGFERWLDAVDAHAAAARRAPAPGHLERATVGPQAGERAAPSSRPAAARGGDGAIAGAGPAAQAPFRLPGERASPLSRPQSRAREAASSARPLVRLDRDGVHVAARQTATGPGWAGALRAELAALGLRLATLRLNGFRVTSAWRS